MRLVTIHLSHNQIATIQNEAFANLENLQFIDLTSNLITSIDNVFTNNTKLKTLRLMENPIKVFTCDFSHIAKNGAAIDFTWESIKIEVSFEPFLAKGSLFLPNFFPKLHFFWKNSESFWKNSKKFSKKISKFKKKFRKFREKEWNHSKRSISSPFFADRSIFRTFCIVFLNHSI